MGILTIVEGNLASRNHRIRKSPFRLPTLLVTVLLCFCVCSVRAQMPPEIVSFQLSKANSSNTVDDYLMKIRLGLPMQDVYLVPTLYQPASAQEHIVGNTIYVPAADRCREVGYIKEWNTIMEPTEDELVDVFVNSSHESDNGVYLVKWLPSFTTRAVNLSLRQGLGQDAKNVTLIELNIENTGVYAWNASETFHSNNLEEFKDYSLMLWTDNPPRRSISQYFTLGDIPLVDFQSDDIPIKRRAIANPPSENPGLEACLDFLESHGGYYNQSGDLVFRSYEGSLEPVEDVTTGWRAELMTGGITDIQWEVKDKRGKAWDFNASDVSTGLVQKGSQGVGMVSLVDLQEKRMNSPSESNVIGLYLGNGDLPGSVVMGGYNNALIDSSNGMAAFVKIDRKDFRVQLSHITFIPGPSLSSRSVTIPSNLKYRQESSSNSVISANIPTLRLSYNTPNILLPSSVIDQLLPHLGSPTFNRELGGHVYPNSPKTDYTLVFTLQNGTQSINVTVDSSSLLAEETAEDNPLTSPQFETARKYLLLAPIQTDDDIQIGYLGRAFLKNIYIVNDDFLNKFHISAVNTTSVANGAEDVRLGSWGILDDSLVSPPSYWGGQPDEVGEEKKPSIVGPIIGGVIGGLALVWIIFLVWYLRRRYKRSKSVKEKGSDGESGQVQRGDTRHTQVIHPAPHEVDEKVAKPKATLNRKSGVTSAFIIDTTSRASLDSRGERKRPPTPPQKDEAYLRMKRFSQPSMRQVSPLAEAARRRQSTPIMALGALSGPHDYSHHYFYGKDDSTVDTDLQHPIPTYHQLLQHHQARKQRASYVESAGSSSGNKSNGTETATLGRVVSKGQVAKIRQLSGTPPNAAHANMLERRASVGRVVSPSEIIVPSRRSSRGSKDLLGGARSPRTRSIGGISRHSSGSGSGGAGVGEQGEGSYSVGGAPMHRRNRSVPLATALPRLPGDDSTNTSVYGLEDARSGAGGIRLIRQATPEDDEPEPTHPECSREGFLESKASSSDDSFTISSSSSTALPRHGTNHKHRRTQSGSAFGEGISEHGSISEKNYEPSPVSPLSETAAPEVRGRYSPLSPTTPQQTTFPTTIGNFSSSNAR